MLICGQLLSNIRQLHQSNTEQDKEILLTTLR